MSTQLDPKPDPFDNLEELKLSQDYVEAAGVRRVLKTVPVRKPGPQEFVRVHPELRLTPAALIELRDEREIFFVAPGLTVELPGDFFTATLYLTINRQGVVSLWPVRLPGPDGRHSDWHKSALEAAEHAKNKWIKIRANMSLGAYEIYEAICEGIPDPVWPDEPFNQLIRIAFRENFVDRIDHPVLRRLRGEI